MTATSAAATLGNSWNRRLSERSRCVPPRPMDQGMRLAPPSLSALDLPQRRVLVAVEDAVVALDLQRTLDDAGYCVIGPATAIGEIQRLIQRGNIDCAVLDLEVDRRSPLPIADLLAFADVPFVYLTTGIPGALPTRHRQRPVVDKPFTREALLAAVAKAMARPRQLANDNCWPAGKAVVPWERVYPPI